jgi:hypothetical protein
MAICNLFSIFPCYRINHEYILKEIMLDVNSQQSTVNSHSILVLRKRANVVSACRGVLADAEAQPAAGIGGGSAVAIAGTEESEVACPFFSPGLFMYHLGHSSFRHVPFKHLNLYYTNFSLIVSN